MLFNYLWIFPGMFLEKPIDMDILLRYNWNGIISLPFLTVQGNYLNESVFYYLKIRCYVTSTAVNPAPLWVYNELVTDLESRAWIGTHYQQEHIPTMHGYNIWSHGFSNQTFNGS